MEELQQDGVILQTCTNSARGTRFTELEVPQVGGYRIPAQNETSSTNSIMTASVSETKPTRETHQGNLGFGLCAKANVLGDPY